MMNEKCNYVGENAIGDVGSTVGGATTGGGGLLGGLAGAASSLFSTLGNIGAGERTRDTTAQQTYASAQQQSGQLNLLAAQAAAAQQKTNTYIVIGVLILMAIIAGFAIWFTVKK